MSSELEFYLLLFCEVSFYSDGCLKSTVLFNEFQDVDDACLHLATYAKLFSNSFPEITVIP